MYADPFADAYPGFDPAHVGYVFTLDVCAADETAALVTFVVKGLSEVYDPRGGYPIARQGRAAVTWSEPVYAGADAQVPAAGIGDRPRDRAGARHWPRRPTCAVSRRVQRSQIANWDRCRVAPAPPAVHRVREDGRRSCRRR